MKPISWRWSYLDRKEEQDSRGMTVVIVSANPNYSDNQNVLLHAQPIYHCFLLAKLVLLLAVLAYADALKCYQGQQSGLSPLNGSATDCPFPACLA
uniref:Uncharacterized protein n=1 Tax=Ditylenchus dipsaci TaxID=166011 RepID=A0A915DI35_9BILA